MKAILNYIWQPRWCKILLAGVVFCALLLLHPYIRQTTFGPTINGTPWCVWEQSVRHAADPDEAKPNWFDKALEKLGIRQQPFEAAPDASPDFVPLYNSLATDSNVKVRRFALAELAAWVGESETKIVPVLKESLKDADPECRLSAARGLWRANKDREIKAVVLALSDRNENLSSQIQQDAVRLLSEMAAEFPELFDAMAKLAEEPNWMTRAQAIDSMYHFGKRGIPVLRKAFHDPEYGVRLAAVSSAFYLGQEAGDLIPDLLQLNDREEGMRRSVSGALYRIDPMRFPKPATVDE